MTNVKLEGYQNDNTLCSVLFHILIQSDLNEHLQVSNFAKNVALKEHAQHFRR